MHVGVFDSGVGGLTVLRSLVRRLPQASFSYLGDTARVPYGNRSVETIHGYAREGLEFLVAQGADLLVVACNTVSAVALPELETALPVPVIGVVRDGVEQAAEQARAHVLVLATRATVRNGSYQRLLLERRPELRVSALACPLLVPLAEEGWADSEVTEAVLRRYLGMIRPDDYDQVILGCTHFPVFLPQLRKLLPQRVDIIDPADRVAQRVAAALAERQVEQAPVLRYFVTDDDGEFRRVARAMGLDVHGMMRRVSL